MDMSTGQDLFRNFIMEGVLPGKEAEAEELLKEGFARQDAGTFDKDYVDEVIPKYSEILHPDRLDSFKLAAEHILSTLSTI